MYVVDTNALLLNCDVVDDLPEVIVPYAVLQELDRIKMEASERGWQARSAVRKLKASTNVRYDLSDDVNIAKNDDKIIDCAVRNNAAVVTGDNLVLLKAQAQGLEVVDVLDAVQEEEYAGYSNIRLTNEELAAFYENSLENLFDLNPNEYAIVFDSNDKYVDVAKCDPITGRLGRLVKITDIDSTQLGKFKPKDVYQRIAIDSLITNQMTMLKGKAGSGKSLIGLSYAFYAMESGKAKDRMDKLICFVNPVSTKQAAKLGYYPGTRDQKLMDSFAGSMLAAKLGGRAEVERLILEEKLMLLPFSDIRGFDTTGMKAIVYIMEAQNLDVDLMKLAIQRVGDDSKLIIDGDFQQQTDSAAYEGSRNGMRRASEVFRGEDYYGEVTLPFIYRSKMAAKADEM